MSFVPDQKCIKCIHMSCRTSHKTDQAKGICWDKNYNRGMPFSSKHKWNVCICEYCGAVCDERHDWKEITEETGSNQIASSYESGNEYGPYTTEYTYRTFLKCSKCGKEKF